MTYLFIRTSGPDLGGKHPAAPPITRGATRNSNLSPAAGSILERGKFAQALFDIALVIFGILFVCTTAAGIGAGLFILLFVRT